MQRLSLLRLSLLAPLALAFSLTGCSDDFGEPCTFPPVGECTNGSSGSTTTTCVFTNSEECTSRICAVYDGSEGFCSASCGEGLSCPEGSSCVEVPSGAPICVPTNLQD